MEGKQLELRLFLLCCELIMSQNTPEKERSDTFYNSSLFPENQPKMEHPELFMFPESLLLVVWKTACTLCISISYYTNLANTTLYAFR